MGNSGAVLLGLVIALVIISALGAAMLSQTSIGKFSLAIDDNSTQAYYLAESGFRYAAAKIVHGTDMNALHDHGEYSLGITGGFTLEFKPYVFDIIGGNGTTELIATVPFGDAPVSSSTAEAGNYYYARINGLTEAFDSISVDASPNDNVVRYTKAGNWSVTNGQRVQFVVKSDGTSLSEGGDLILQNTSPADLFPERNGYIIIDNKTYKYQEREINRLSGITRVDDNWGTSPALSDGDDIVLKSFLQLTSTGRVGTGGMVTTREITYNTPLSESGKIEFHDMFEDRSHWEATSTLGSHSIQTIDGNKALKVDNTSSVGLYEMSEIVLDPSTTEVDLGGTHSSAGKFLSYDTQVKVGFDPFVPTHFMPGITFRKDSSGNALCVSFQQPANHYSYDGSIDRIPDEIVPGDLQSSFGIVLWQYTSSSWKWIAYQKIIPVTFFSDDMESFIPGNWDTSNFAHNQWGRVTNRAHSGSYSWNDSPGGNYHNNEYSWIMSKSIDLSSVSSAKLIFWHYEVFEPQGDRGHVWISTDGGSSWTKIAGDYNNNDNYWKQVEIDISSYVPSADVVISFDFQSGPDNDTDEGWYIDDVMIVSDDLYFPINDATLLVRLYEAASIEFTGGSSEARSGSVITQDNGARGTVVGAPILSSGSWGGGNAAGTIMLNKISGTFQNADIKVAGIPIATATPNFRSRDNYIKVYYGDTAGYGTPGSDPLDKEKGANPRISTSSESVNWPVENVNDTNSANDYFTLVQWNSNLNDASATRLGTGKESNAIIRLDNPDYFTPSAGTFSSSEFGLHTLGRDNYSKNVYFDDFAIQVEPLFPFTF